jgi:hypothetical protein
MQIPRPKQRIEKHALTGWTPRFRDAIARVAFLFFFTCSAKCWGVPRSFAAHRKHRWPAAIGAMT